MSTRLRNASALLGGNSGAQQAIPAQSLELLACTETSAPVLSQQSYVCMPCMHRGWFGGDGARRVDGTRTVAFEPLQGVSADMLAVAVGMFTRLATGRDGAGRRVSVWALPGGTAEDAAVPWAILSNATTAWADFTGQPLPGLGKVDMVVWNGASPWSTAQHGLLVMDRFRTLWRAGASTATDLVRCAHVICHEIGHLWFGGLLQTLATEEISFIQVGTLLLLLPPWSGPGWSRPG